MTVKGMDNVLIVVDDLEATTAFFIELGLELEGARPTGGDWTDGVTGSREQFEVQFLDLLTSCLGKPLHPCPHGSGYRNELSEESRSGTLAAMGNPSPSISLTV